MASKSSSEKKPLFKYVKKAPLKMLNQAKQLTTPFINEKMTIGLGLII